MTSLSENTVVTTSGGLVELGYVEGNFPSNSITATTAATAQTLMGAVNVVCDGGPIELEVFLAGARPDLGAGNRQLYLTLLIDGTRVLDQFGLIITPAAGDVYRPTTIKRRMTPTAGVHTYEVRAYVDAGTGYIESGSTASRPRSYIKVNKIIQASQFIVPLASAPLVTSLPSAPIDGQEIRYLADATNGVVWNLRYRAASASSYKWEFVGGSSLRSTGAGSSTNSTTPQTTNTPSITVPLAGDYDCSYGGFTQNTAYGVVYNSTIYLYKDTTSLESLTFVPVGTYNGASIAGVYRATSLTASQVLNLRYAVSTTSSTSSFGTLFINATPIRVG